MPWGNSSTHNDAIFNCLILADHQTTRRLRLHRLLLCTFFAVHCVAGGLSPTVRSLGGLQTDWTRPGRTCVAVHHGGGDATRGACRLHGLPSWYAAQWRRADGDAGGVLHTASGRTSRRSRCFLGLAELVKEQAVRLPRPWGELELRSTCSGALPASAVADVPLQVI